MHKLEHCDECNTTLAWNGSNHKKWCSQHPRNNRTEISAPNPQKDVIPKLPKEDDWDGKTQPERRQIISEKIVHMKQFEYDKMTTTIAELEAENMELADEVKKLVIPQNAPHSEALRLKGLVIELEASLRIDRMQQANLWQNISKYQYKICKLSVVLKKVFKTIKELPKLYTEDVDVTNFGLIDWAFSDELINQIDAAVTLADEEEDSEYPDDIFAVAIKEIRK